LSAIGSENHASVSVVIKDTDEQKAITGSSDDAMKSFLKTKDDPPKIAHPSTNSPPVHMIHSELTTPPSIVPMPTVAPVTPPSIVPMPTLASSFSSSTPNMLTTNQKVSDILKALSKTPSTSTPIAAASTPVMPGSQTNNIVIPPSMTSIAPLPTTPSPAASA